MKLYEVYFAYDGDAFTDYSTYLMVEADSPEEAISKARGSREVFNRYSNPHGFRILNENAQFSSFEEWEREFPYSNYSVILEDGTFIGGEDRLREKRMKGGARHAAKRARYDDDILFA